MLQRFKKLSGRILLVALFCLPGLSNVLANTEPVFTNVRENSDLELVFRTPELYHVVEDSSKNQVLASILAFPLPFGMLGLHRIYLGANPGIPILYILTFGGLFGILPFIDMMVLILSRDTKPFYKNSRILMWNRKTP